MAEETAHLAPHGVPSNPIPRALSSTRLHELATNEPGYGATYNTTGGNLDIPGHYQPQPQPQPVPSNISLSLIYQIFHFVICKENYLYENFFLYMMNLNILLV